MSREPTPIHMPVVTPLRLFGRGCVADFLDDFIVYRGLNPVDPRLPALVECAHQAGLVLEQPPRKHVPEYARLVVNLLRAARQLSLPGAALERLIFLGDTRLSDGSAFQNLAQAGGWSGLAFIGNEDRTPPLLQVEQLPGLQPLYSANRWALLDEFDHKRQQQGFSVDEHTVVVIDLDKTAMGGRGRNSAAIDDVRVEAVRQTVSSLLGPVFDPEQFRTAYDRLNRAEFHPFTADNQDYLAYICLVVGAGLIALERLIERIHAGELVSFEQLIVEVEPQKNCLPPALAALHEDFLGRVRAGDPTPFKAFRRNEYCLTAARLGCLGDAAPLEQRLAYEIVLTQEVYAAALSWKAKGALIFGLSDKPDEASLPTEAQAADGWQPLHRIQTHIVGSLEEN